MLLLLVVLVVLVVVVVVGGGGGGGGAVAVVVLVYGMRCMICDSWLVVRDSYCWQLAVVLVLVFSSQWSDCFLACLFARLFVHLCFV